MQTVNWRRDGGRGGNLQISLLVSCVRASTFPVKGDISSSYLICPDQWLGLRRFYGTFEQQRAFQLTKCVDYHQSLNNKPVQSCPICPRWEITGSLWLASHILHTSASWSLTPFSRRAAPSIILLRKQQRWIDWKRCSCVQYYQFPELWFARISRKSFTPPSYFCACVWVARLRVHRWMVRKTWGFMMCDIDCVPVSWTWLRIPGVLQRLGFTYFVLSLLQTFWGQREISPTAVSSTVRFTLIRHCTLEGGKKTQKSWKEDQARHIFKVEMLFAPG